jgi:hypothetical protein
MTDTQNRQAKAEQRIVLNAAAREARANDSLKVEHAVADILTAALVAGKKYVMVNTRTFMSGRKFSTFTLQKAWLEVEDILTGAGFIQHYGEWISTEYESGVKVFIQLSDVGQKILLARHDEIQYQSEAMETRMIAQAIEMAEDELNDDIDE